MIKTERIVIATGIYPPSVGGPATYSKILFDELNRKEGVEVEVVTFDDVRHLPRIIRHLAYAIKLANKSRGAKTIFAQDPFSVGAPAWLISFLMRKNFILKVVGDFAWEQAQGRMNYKNSLDHFQNDQKIPLTAKILRTIERFIARQAKTVITPSQYLKSVIMHWAVDGEKIEVIHNSFEVPENLPTKSASRAKINEKYGLNNDDILIVSAGRFVAWKGFDRLIEVIEIIKKTKPNAKLIIAGDGPYRNKIEEVAKDHSAEEWLILTGNLPKNELFELISASDCFALDTEYEGLSHQILEVRVLGTPIVTTNVCGNPELITDNVTGKLVPPANREAMAKAIIEILDDKIIADRLSENAKILPETFTKESMLKSVSEIILPIEKEKPVKVILLSTDRSIATPDSRTKTRLDQYKKMFNGEIEVIVPEGGNKLLSILKYIYHAIFIPLKNYKKYRLIISAQDPFETGLIGSVASLLSGAKLHVQVHIDFYNKYFKSESWRQHIQSIIAPFVLRRAKAIRVVSERIEKHLIESMKINGSEISCIPITSDIESLLHKKESSDLKADHPEFEKIIIAPCRFVKQKNLPMLMQAFKMAQKTHPKIGLLLVGDGREKGALLKLREKLNIEKSVKFMPWTPNVLDLIQSADIFAMSSNYEGWGMTAIEAGALGTPIVMTDVGCAGSVIKNEESGLVVEVGNAEAFANAINRLIAEQGLAESLSTKAKQAVSKLKSGESYNREIISSWLSAL